MSNLKKELETLINRNSIEGKSDTPDFILANYLADCLKVYAKTVKARDNWYSFEPNNKLFETAVTEARKEV